MCKNTNRRRADTHTQINIAAEAALYMEWVIEGGLLWMRLHKKCTSANEIEDEASNNVLRPVYPF